MEPFNHFYNFPIRITMRVKSTPRSLYNLKLISIAEPPTNIKLFIGRPPVTNKLFIGV